MGQDGIGWDWTAWMGQYGMGQDKMEWDWTLMDAMGSNEVSGVQFLDQVSTNQPTYCLSLDLRRKRPNVRRCSWTRSAWMPRSRSWRRTWLPWRTRTPRYMKTFLKSARNHLDFLNSLLHAWGKTMISYEIPSHREGGYCYWF